tara:strand:- start:1387 stop:1962 length:576 start_codon:yes stop_codon:yes gene_type:complete
MRMIIYLLLSLYFLLENPSILSSLDLSWLPCFAPGVLLGLLIFYIMRNNELSRKLLGWLLLLTPIFKPLQPYYALLPGGMWALLSFIGGYFCIYFYLEKRLCGNKLEIVLWQHSSVVSAGLKHFFYKIFSDILVYLQLILGILVVVTFSFLQNLVSSHSLLTNPWIDGSINILIALFAISLMEPLETQTCE